MEAAETVKPVHENKAEVPSLEGPQDAIEKPIEESRPEGHTNGTEETADDKSLKEKEPEKNSGKEPENSKQDEPSERVKEGQRYNDRNRGGRGRGDRGIRGGRGGRGNYQDRPFKKNNIKSDLTSQQESSDSVAIRKQVGTAQQGTFD